MAAESGRAHGARRWPSLALAVVFVVGYVLVASVVLVRGRLLDADVYADALARNDAYERVYTEVLADPELAEPVEHLLGDLRFDALDPVQVRALSTSALRWTVPPSRLQQGTETAVAAILGYVRGDTPRLDPEIDVTGVLDRIDSTAVVEVRTLLASAPDRIVTTLDDYRAAVASFADTLSSGTVPDSVPVLGGTTVDSAQVARVIVDGLGVDADPRVREQIVAAVASGDARDGLITATRDDVNRVADRASARLRTSLEDSRHLDVIGEVADRADRSKAAVVGRLDTVRDVASWFRPATAVVGGVVMAVAAGGIVWLNRSRPRRAGLILAGAAAGAGLAVLALWVVVTSLVDDPLGPATTAAGEGSASWNLPGGLRSLLADIVDSLGDELVRTVQRLVLFPVAAGAVAAVLLAVAPRLSRLRQRSRQPGQPRPRPSAARPALAAGTALATGAAVVVVGVAAGLVSTVATGAAADPARLCNGHAELCDRRYDQVVYAATHNSMSSPDVVSVWPEHDGDIRAQLDAGVRALLIDTHHWTPLVSAEQLTAADPLLPASLADQVFSTLGPLREGRDGTYLCHNECALGAIPLIDSLRSIRQFLDDNPDDVVTLIIQDAITPEETADVFAEAGLDRFVHAHRLGTRWATLGDLIDRDERLVVFAEDQGPPPAWYQPAFENMQETPYLFEEPGAFSCDRNRGDRDAPLFLLNHWVQRIAPDRVDAVDVNRRAAIVDRARECQRARGRLPNYIAVNFYNIGDLMPAVDTLNDLD